jgi:hypothetical protein
MALLAPLWSRLRDEAENPVTPFEARVNRVAILGDNGAFLQDRRCLRQYAAKSCARSPVIRRRRLDSLVEAVMLPSVDRYEPIGEHFARKGFGHLRPAAQFLTGLHRGAFSLRRHDGFASRHPLLDLR